MPSIGQQVIGGVGDRVDFIWSDVVYTGAGVSTIVFSKLQVRLAEPVTGIIWDQLCRSVTARVGSLARGEQEE